MKSTTRKLLVLAGLIALTAPLIGSVAHSTPCHQATAPVSVGVATPPAGSHTALGGVAFDAPTRL